MIILVSLIYYIKFIMKIFDDNIILIYLNVHMIDLVQNVDVADSSSAFIKSLSNRKIIRIGLVYISISEIDTSGL